MNNAASTRIDYDRIMEQRHRHPTRAWKPAMMQTFAAQPYTTAITLAWNWSVGRVRARQDLSTVVAFIDRQMLGPRYFQKSAADRADAVFVFEGFDTGHVHVHSLWRAPQNRWFEMGKLFTDWRSSKFAQRHDRSRTLTSPRLGVWNKVVPNGSHALAAMNHYGNNDEIIGYVLKDQHAKSDVRDIVWSSDFHR